MHSRHNRSSNFGTVDVTGVDILEVDIIVGVDIFGIDITALPHIHNRYSIEIAWNRNIREQTYIQKIKTSTQFSGSSLRATL